MSWFLFSAGMRPVGGFRQPVMRQWLDAETARLLAAYGNHHRSSCFREQRAAQLFSLHAAMGGENYAKDNRRLYSAGTAGRIRRSQRRRAVRHARALRRQRIAQQHRLVRRRLRRRAREVHVPVLAHEVGQWCAYPDFDVMKKFTGYLQPAITIFLNTSRAKWCARRGQRVRVGFRPISIGMLQRGDRANLRTPSLAGFQLLDLHDYLARHRARRRAGCVLGKQGYVGRMSSNILRTGRAAGMAQERVFTTDEKLEADIGVANFGR